MYVLDTLVTINMVTRIISSTDIEDVKENCEFYFCLTI